jgi:copper chaperone CopZ
MSELKLEIGGMSCGHCVASVRRALEAVKGVEVIGVTVGGATVKLDPTIASKDQLIDAVEDQGYEVVGTA